MAALKVDTAGLHAVAAGLRSAAQTLAQLGTKPPAHPALATDETSTSAATRLSEHGSVVASRAIDAAAVLNSAADAITQAAQSYTAMNTANATLVALQGNPAAATASPTPAVTADATAAHVPMAPQTSRPAETTAAIMEAGQASAGAPFVSGCIALGEAFGDGARSARTAAGAVSQHLQGAAGPTISAALNRYADWSDSMTRYTHLLGQMAGDHRDRFAEAQHSTPSTADFAARHQELQNAISMYSSHPTPGAAQAVSKARSNVSALTRRTHVAATTYRTGEEPETPPGPPPVVPIVEPDGGQGDTPSAPGQDGTEPQALPTKTKAAPGSDDDGDDVVADGSRRFGRRPRPRVRGQPGWGIRPRGWGGIAAVDDDWPAWWHGWDGGLDPREVGSRSSAVRAASHPGGLRAGIGAQRQRQARRRCPPRRPGRLVRWRWRRRR